MKVLIIGQAGENPWAGGASSARLWRWFNFSSHSELQAFARLMNVYEKKQERVCSLSHMSAIGDAMREADIVFLVGRVAQSLIEEYHRHCFKLLWSEGKYVGLPHPSGLNRQLNSIDDVDVRTFVNGALNVCKANLCSG